MNKAKITSLYLMSAQYNFTKPDKKMVSVSVKDEIEISEIVEKNAVLKVIRNLNFGEGTNSFIRIEFETGLELIDECSKEELVSLLKSGIPTLSIVYSKISLLISEISNSSPFGLIVTPPTNNSKSVLIS